MNDSEAPTNSTESALTRTSPNSDIPPSTEEAWGELNESLLDPQQQSLNLAARLLGILLVATWILPIGRAQGAPINVWDTFGVVKTIDVVRLLLPGAVGVLFIAVGFFLQLTVKWKSTLMTGGLLSLLAIGINPFAVLSVVIPPIDGRVAELMFDMVDGSYFPREDLLHLTLLGLGLGLFGIAGRYRTLVQTSQLGGYLMAIASAFLVAYYVWPYTSGKVPAIGNASLYAEYHAFPERIQNGVRALENELYQLDPDIIHTTHFQKIGRDVKLLGQVKLTSVYFLCIYFVPLLLILTAIPALRPSRYLNHRTVPAKLVCWGASAYLMAFLFPLLVKESGRSTGDGFLAALRNYTLFISIFAGLTVAASSALHEWFEPEQSNDTLPADPLSWKDV